MSFPKTLPTDLDGLQLIKPDIDRDAETSLHWLEGDTGVNTLILMGVPREKITQPKIAEETERIKDFLERQDQLNWALSYMGRVIGATWVDLVENNSVKPPSVHIMIGDSSVRGKGIGSATIKAVLQYLIDELSYDIIYSRHLSNNVPITKVFESLGFVDDGHLYSDKDGLVWQNVVLKARNYK